MYLQSGRLCISALLSLLEKRNAEVFQWFYIDADQ